MKITSKNMEIIKDKFKSTQCRICNTKNLHTFLSLGSMPIPNGFFGQSQLKDKEIQYPLEACVCTNCWLVQLTHTIPASIMFKNYLYIPSTSTTMLSHFKTFAEETIDKFKLKHFDLVIDIGSNDGTLLGYFKDQEIKVLGIDPASNLAQVARLKGIDTIDDFFTSTLARQIALKYGKAKVITATNVVAHIDNLHDMCKGVDELLDKNGVFICEFPYVVDLIDKNEFDTIYHEHLSYFAIKPLITLFERYDFSIFDIKRTSIHGGSIRVYVDRKKSKYKQKKIVNEFIKQEELKKMNKLNTYEDFARRVKVIKRDLVDYLKKQKEQGKKIVGYGASAKGNVLLNYCEITTSLLDYIVDSISYKQGLFTPGTHIPIYPESRLNKDMPDYVLLLAWNFADEILRKQITYREHGGQFIITIPYLRIE
jgi:D-mycarose 3-C-methyltransferase